MNLTKWVIQKLLEALTRRVAEKDILDSIGSQYHLIIKVLRPIKRGPFKVHF